MSLHGIKLTKPKRRKSSRQQPSASLVSAQSLHACTSSEPAMAQQAASMPCQQSSPQASCEVDLDGEQHEEGLQQQEAQAVSASAARVSTDRQRRSTSIPAAEVSSDDGKDVLPVGEPTDANIEAAADMVPMWDEPPEADVDPNDDTGPALDQPVEDMQPSHVQQEDASDDEMVRS